MAKRLAPFVDLTLSDEESELEITGSREVQYAETTNEDSVRYQRDRPCDSQTPRAHPRPIQHQVENVLYARAGVLSHERNESPNNSLCASPRKKMSPQKLSESRNVQQSAEHLSRSPGVTQSDFTNFVKRAEPVKTLELRYRRSRCTECVQNDVNCDGMQPCAFCEEPGFDCVYPDLSPGLRVSTRPQSHAKPKESGMSDISASVEDDSVVHTVRSAVDGENGTDKYLEGEPLGHVRRNLERMNRPELEALEWIPRNRWLPASLGELTELIRVHHENLNMHREFVLQIQLRQARKRSQARNPIPASDSKSERKNPFRPLLEEKTPFRFQNASSTSTKLQIRPHYGKKKIFATTELEVRSLPVDQALSLLPKYRSIGRLGTSFLSKNVHTLKYMPYFVDDEAANDNERAEKERNQELRERYRNKNFDVENTGFLEELRQQRKCLERVWHWSAEFHRLLDELQLSTGKLSTWIARSTFRKCGTCQITPNLLVLTKPDFNLSSEEAQRCQWLSESFLELTSIPVWHFLHQDDGIPEKKAGRTFETNRTKPTLCSICFVHNCLTHGAYVDGDEEVNVRAAFVDDPENENNKRVRATTESKIVDGEHLCGVFCFDHYAAEKQSLQAMFTSVAGIGREDTLDGPFNEVILAKGELAHFKDFAFCDRECFLQRPKRPDWFRANNPSKQEPKPHLIQLTKSLTKVYGNNLRLPCLLAKMCNVSCMSALTYVLRVHLDPPHPVKHSAWHAPESESTVEKTVRPPGGYNTENSHVLDMRRTMLPCQHDGPCLGSNCSCAKSRVHCERFCGCDTSCRRRFRGCRCRMDNPKGVCFKDDRCECFSLNRECDPWICGTCGVLEVLDPPNKYRPEIRHGRCQNCMIQLDLPAKTIKAPSEVQGWGLFAGEDLDQHAFIGEYKGEIISAGDGCESDRRGVVYHNGGLEYLFKTNSEQEIDGSSFGNKTRFMNNSELPQNINVGSQKLIANSLQRIMFYALRPIKAGEELLYNYNYPKEVTKAFWERGEKPVGHGRDVKGLFVTPAKPRLSNRVARQAGAISAGGNEAEELVRQGKRPQTGKIDVRKGKRKRRLSESDEEGEGLGFGNEDAEDDYDEVAGQLRSDLTRDLDLRRWQKRNLHGGQSSYGNSDSGSKYVEEEEETDDDYEHQESEQESEPETEPQLSATESENDMVPRRRRKTNPLTDGRFGGAAQRKAASTRRERRARGGKY